MAALPRARPQHPGQEAAQGLSRRVLLPPLGLALPRGGCFGVLLARGVRDLLDPTGRGGGRRRQPRAGSSVGGAGDLGDRREQEQDAGSLQSRSRAGEHRECPGSCSEEGDLAASGSGLRDGVPEGCPAPRQSPVPRGTAEPWQGPGWAPTPAQLG